MRKIILLLSILFLTVSLYAQKSVQVSGTVNDENGMTLPGASIIIKEKRGIGTTSDSKGAFTIKAEIGQTLVFSFIGYKNIEYPVTKDETGILISFKGSTEDLDEVVVTALGKQRKISVVGAISSIETKDLQVPTTSLANILGGRMPGIITMQTSGEPGKNISEFWIRGISTFGANSSALVLIDGLEGNLNSVDPADIESFSILKDASATAVYGVRGANGVVIITTKKGEKGKLKITGRTGFSISQLKRLPQYLHAYDYALLANEARSVRGDIPIYDENTMSIIKYGLDKDLYPDVDWQKEIVNPLSFQQTYYVSAQGGGDAAKYFLSLSTSNESAAYKQDENSPYKSKTGYDTYSFRSNLDLDLTKLTSVYFGVDGYLTQKNQPGLASTDYIWEAQSQLTPLLIPKFYSTGQLPAWGTTNNYSPYVMLNYTGTSSNQTISTNSTIAVTQDLKFITPGLKLRVQGAFNTNTWFNERRYVSPEMYYASSRDVDGQLQLAKKLEKVAAFYSFSQDQYRKYHLESTFTYDKTVANDHRFSALLYYYMSDSKRVQDILSSGVGSSMAAIPKRYQGISSRLTYGFKDIYLLDINFGYTGSENFQKGRRFGFFPSVALGWVPTNYNWVKENLTWISFLKFRASYGTVGNDKISYSRFPYLTIINENYSAGWRGTEGGITETVVGADNLMWEKAIKANAGVEGRLFKENIVFVLDVFNDQRDGIFQPRTQIPDYAGLIQMPYGNVGRMKSYGADGNISYSYKITKEMSFTLRGNFTYSKNLVQNWEQPYPKYPYQQIAGYPYNVVRGYIALGLFRDEQDVNNSPAQNFGSKVLPGDIKYKDVNGDGAINTDDKVVISNPSYPWLMYGFGGEYNYKNLTIGVLFKGTGNTDIFHAGFGFGDGMGYIPFHNESVGNVLEIVADPKNRWIPASYSGDPSTENPNAHFPRLTYGYNANNSQLSTFWKDNSKYLRLQEVTVNYHLKKDILKRIGLSSMDLQFVGNNLYVWDKIKFIDPEQAIYNGRAYPIPAKYSFQVYLNL